MTNKEKANELSKKGFKDFNNPYTRVTIAHVKHCCLEMAKWKDNEYKTAYVVTRSEEHCDYVEKVFFDKGKAEEYCKPFNEDENSYHRDITKIEVSL